MSILTSKPPAVRAVSEGEAARNSAWQRDLRAAVRDAHELCRRLGLPAALADAAAGGADEFPVFVPPAYLARIRPGDPHDPLLRQVLPVADETTEAPGFSRDPVADKQATLQPGVLQKYAGRALLVTTGACAVHCRYCFRRHFPYEEVPHSAAAWDTALRKIAADDSLQEVILSGGDPLMLLDDRLATLVEKIAAIQHVTRLRVHTRLPVMIPTRVTEELIAWLTGTRLTPVVVIHANHARELDDAVADSLSRLRQASVTLLNQAVLLRGVNDSTAALAALGERLIEIGVVPYYLHQLDRVAGAAHFEVPIERGRQIVDELRARLPGYMVPRYVQEIPGKPNKTALA
ncbi:MAG: EF-P beta-lysylation protein EpmB [Planctomycetes bacterium]|nr:EF-P beta-lysylation protein EpmB [Planctomycetota bacterium]